MGSGLVADIIVIPDRTRTVCIWGLCRLGTKSSLTLRWRGESEANQSLNRAGELGPNFKTFMDHIGSVRAPFRARIGRNLAFVPRPASPVIPLKLLKAFCFCRQRV